MDDLLRELKPVGSFRTIAKDGNVLFQGEVPRYVMVVRSGVIRAYTITSNGEERTVSLHGDGDILPLTWALGITSNTLFYYEAVTDCRVFQVPKKTFTEYLDAKPERLRDMLRYTSNLYT